MSKPRLRALTLTACLVALVAMALGFISAAAAPAAKRPSGRTAANGTVSVLFAGSLVNYMERYLGPSFQKADGYGFTGFGGGSSELASEIRGRVRTGDVFVSAAAAADRSLEGSANGAWVSWYSAFMGSPLELAYNPNSKFGAELRRGVPWYKVLTQSGIRVGRTDPKLDPKGVLTVEAVDNAARRLHRPALATALSSFEVFPETGLVGRLQSGQLDAGFFYTVEAKNAKLSTVSLAPVYKYALYTVTILNRAPNPTGAAALIRYLLSAARGYTLKKNGLTPITPRFSGRVSAVPTGLRSLAGAH
ncbi:MAG TPA: substrate-binding domain-containing protein [Solirubrobacteraceae bacterium]|jgi:molybdate/tungstate transport system substrate-binding protein|nr:substrate-binding domain-containing protein [Solirubrobacteraceae bacterium]